MLVNDVLEPEPEEFIQVDRVAVGPPGIYLVETKAWEGALMGYKDRLGRIDRAAAAGYDEAGPW